MTDEELVREWQLKKDTSALNDLRRRTRQLVQSQVYKYRANAIPQPVLESEADKLFVDAVNSYDPVRAASFRTHLFTKLKRLNRFSISRANIATIPEARAQKIGVYKNVYEELEGRKHRPPTTTELADELNWPLAEVMTIQRSLRRDIPASGITDGGRLDTSLAREKRLIDDIWYELTPDEKKVFEYLTGTRGKRKLEKGMDLARATGFSQAKISQLRKAIGRKIERHL